MAMITLLNGEVWYILSFTQIFEILDAILKSANAVDYEWP